MDKSIYSREYEKFLMSLRRARKLAKLSQSELAAKLGETQSFVSKCERGERRIDVVELRWWLAALNISVIDFFVNQENSMTVSQCNALSPN